MWSLSIGPFWQNCTDEFWPGEFDKALGLYLASGFCLIGLYAAPHANQYFIILLNNNFGLWKDDEAELYKTLQWQLWQWIKRS